MPYKATFWVSPYSGVKREPARYTVEMEPNRGAKHPEVEIKADEFEDALIQARAIMRGIQLDERVCFLKLESLVKVKP